MSRPQVDNREGQSSTSNGTHPLTGNGVENRSEGLSAIASFSDITSVSMEIPASQPLFSSPDLTSRSEGSVNALRMRPATYTNASAVAAAPAAELGPEAGANASTSAAADDNPAIRELPAFTPACFSNSQWGNLTSDEFSHAIMAAYSEAVHWKVQEAVHLSCSIRVSG